MEVKVPINIPDDQLLDAVESIFKKIRANWKTRHGLDESN